MFLDIIRYSFDPTCFVFIPFVWATVGAYIFLKTKKLPVKTAVALGVYLWLVLALNPIIKKCLSPEPKGLTESGKQLRQEVSDFQLEENYKEIHKQNAKDVRTSEQNEHKEALDSFDEEMKKEAEKIQKRTRKETK